MPTGKDIGLNLEYNLEDIEVEDIVIKYEEVQKAKGQENKSNVIKHKKNTVDKELLLNENGFKLEDYNLEDLKVEEISLRYDWVEETNEVWENKYNVNKYGSCTVTEIFNGKSEIKIEPQDMKLEEEIYGYTKEQDFPPDGKIELSSLWAKSILAIHENNTSFQCETASTKEKLFKDRNFDASYKHKAWFITSVHGKKKSYHCNECEFFCDFKSELSTHYKSIHYNEKTFKCNECNHSCMRKELMSVHIREVHKKIKPFKCQKKLSKKYILSEHIHEIKEKQPSCNKSDKSINLPAPIKPVDEERTSTKLKSCDNSNYLKSKAVNNEQQQQFKCSWCDISFTRNYSLATHIRSVHKKEKPFKCDDCTSSFFRKDRLDRHIRGVHKKERLLQCTMCDYSSHRKDKLSRHFRGVHENIKPRNCDKCKYSCYTTNELAKHIHKVHKNVKPFKIFAC